MKKTDTQLDTFLNDRPEMRTPINEFSTYGSLNLVKSLL